MRDIKILTFVFLASIVLWGCVGDPDQSSVPTQLIDGFVSRQSVSAVEAQLMSAGGIVTFIEAGVSKEEASFFRTPMSHRVMSVSGYVYYGSKGELRLEFINDRLASTWFIPDDHEMFEASLSGQLKGVSASSPMLIKPATEVRVGMDFRGRKYWAWEDINLREELDCWIRDNS